MKSKLRRFFDRTRPTFEKGGKLHALGAVHEGMESFLLTPKTTSSSGTHIHDSIDSKRVMIIVVLALMPCLLFGMYNAGYQNALASGIANSFFDKVLYGLLAILPKIVVTYAVGLGIEFIVAQKRGEEIQEGFLVTGLLIPMICPVETPLWMLALATAFAVVFAKEVFGGTGYNIFNVALVARAFLFFSYPAKMSGDQVFVGTHPILGIGGQVADGFSGATPLGQLATSFEHNPNSAFGAVFHSVAGQPLTDWDLFLGLIPGSFGETSTLCILIGMLILLCTGIASWRIILSGVAGCVVTSLIAMACASATYPATFLTIGEQLCLGGFAFAIVFMATDPVTACHTNTGKLIYGFLIGAVAVIIRCYNNGYPEGAMLAVLLGNALAPLIDWLVVNANIRRRTRRLRQSVTTLKEAEQ